MISMISLSSSDSLASKLENKTKYNLCEVCLKPFNLSNIEMHLEAGCGVEIQNRYNITQATTGKTEKTIKHENTKFKVPKKKQNSSTATGKNKKKNQKQ